ncbi:MAG: molybdopterin-dependent oxidoreductase [Treponema sp.]|nr:molybdopterin-dependent oxidoreductase [Treponema sp.]
MAVGKKNTKDKLLRSLDTEGFYSDYSKPGMLHAKLIRSPSDSGRIKSIELENMPEGYFLFTYDNIPGAKAISINKTSTNIFGGKTIAYRGEPVAILAGPDESLLNELVEKVNISFYVGNLETALDNVIKKHKDAQQEQFADKSQKNESGLNEADASDMAELINDLPSLNNVIDKSHFEEFSAKQVAFREVKYGLYQEKSLEEADKELFEDSGLFTTTDTWQQTTDTPRWQETDGAFSYMDGKDLHIYTPTRWTSFVQKSISEALQIPQENIYIHKTKSAGLFPNGLWRTTQTAVQTAIAAYLSKKPVKLVLSHEEQDLFMKPGVITNITYKTALEPDGRIYALKVMIDIDIGSSNPFAQEITDRIALASFSFYKPKNLYIKAVTHTSKKPPTTISIKNIDSQAFFAIENEVQKICNQIKIFPDEFRLINSQEAVDKKKKTEENPFPFDISINGLDTTLQTVLKDSDFNRKYASFHMEAIDRVEKNSKPFFALPLRGVGLASAYAVSGYSGVTSFSYDSKIEVTLYKDDKLVIHAIKPSAVIQEIWKKTAAEILEIPAQNVVIDSNFTVDSLPASPEDTFTSIGIMNELIKKCCTEIQKKRFHQPLPISSKKGVQKNTRKKWDKELFCGTPFYTTSFASAVVEIELDTYTYNEKIKGIWIAIDCGELYDEAAAFRTVRLEVQQELTMLVRNKGIRCDAIHIKFMKSDNKSGQIGGLVHNVLPAAFSSALSLALTKQLTGIPCTEARLFTLIKNRIRTDIKQDSKKEANK